MSKILFVGAGPGDPELITIKGYKALQKADLIIYAGSLVNPELLEINECGAEIYNSATMTLDEVLETMILAYRNNKNIVRLHTGDPSIYGAIKEQMDGLEQENIEFDVIPGVSSFVASAAAIKKEFTLPEVSQTVICTRIEGRTPVPEKEQLSMLSKHRASMAIFLSVHMIDKVVDALLEGYSEDTPVAVIQKATWEDQKIVLGQLKNIESKVKAANITKTAQILVGDFIDCKYAKSKLYDKGFTHEYRVGK